MTEPARHPDLFRFATQMLKNFHRDFEHHAPTKPTLDDYPFRLRASLILEEAIEFAEACGFRPHAFKGADLHGNSTGFGLRRTGSPDWVEMIDALCDLLYVVFGAFVSMGVSPDDFFAEVHRSNMAKVGGGKDEHGKSLKPASWTSPQIEALLDELIPRTK